MSTALVSSLTHTPSLHVNHELLVTAFAPQFSVLADLPPVFGTALVAGFMEWACTQALRVAPHPVHADNIRAA